MKLEKIISWAAIAYFGYNLLVQAGAKIAAQFSAGKPKLKFKRINPTGVDLELTVPVINRTAAPLPIDDLDVQIYYGNEQIASTKLRDRVIIRPNATTDVRLNLSVPYLGLSTTVVNLLQTKTLETNLVADGQVVSGGIVVPFVQTITLI